MAVAIAMTGLLGLAGCSKKGSGEGGAAALSATATTAPAPPPPAAPSVYSMEVNAEGNTSLVLHRITVDARSTTLEVSFKNGSRGEVSMAVSEPGSDHSMFLQLADGKKVAFKSATGIEINPVRTKVKAGQTQNFTLVFDALPPGARSFDVFEGEDAKDPIKKKKQNLWVWRGLQLK